MALGAPPSAMWVSVLGGALVQVVVGLALACWGHGALRGPSAFLFEVRPHDPGVYFGAVAVLALAGHSRHCSQLVARRRPTL